jgi:N-acetylglucosaminyldiphosphoundecaprenol N-acetyl-beta-D-mannosaminyltransferase
LVLFGIPVHNLTQREVVAEIIKRAAAGSPCQIVTANLDFALQAWRDPEMHRILFDADLVVADGMPFVWFSRLFGPVVKERVAGSDLVAPIARQASRHFLSMYAMGAAPGIAARALARLQEENPGLIVAGSDSPPCAPLACMNHEDLLKKLDDARPDILLVAFGAPKQEKWIRMHLNTWSVPVSIGVGASLDFLAGEHKRAPVCFQKMGLEWFWRMAREPRRLVRRYGADLLFLAKMMAKLAVIRLRPSEAAAPWTPDAARIEELGGALASFRPIPTSEKAAEFLEALEPVSQERPLVLDMTGLQWLSSLELGVLTRLAKTSRRSGLRLILVSIPTRIRELLHYFRLDHYVEMPRSVGALESALDNLSHPAENGRAFVRMSDNRLNVLLPSEFGRDQVADLRTEILRRWKSQRLVGIAIDGSRTTFLDGPAAQLISEIGRMVVGVNGTVWLQGFRDPILRFMRHEGLGRIGKFAPSPGWKSRRSVRPRADSSRV